MIVTGCGESIANLIKFKASLPLILELETLKILSLRNCNNIVLGNKSCKNLKEISIDCCKNINDGVILILPKLESFKVYLDYHLRTCERKDLLGASSHVLDIVTKK